jgi:hypothetical protein
MKTLPIVKCDGKLWYVDTRLSELRNVSDPTDSQHESLEVLEWIVSQRITDLDENQEEADALIDAWKTRHAD